MKTVEQIKSITEIINVYCDECGKKLVTEVFGLFVVRYFVVKDKTGEIIVVTKRPLPSEGTKITVKGTVREAFSIGDKQLVVVLENEEK